MKKAELLGIVSYLHLPNVMQEVVDLVHGQRDERSRLIGNTAPPMAGIATAVSALELTNHPASDLSTGRVFANVVGAAVLASIATAIVTRKRRKSSRDREAMHTRKLGELAHASTHPIVSGFVGGGATHVAVDENKNVLFIKAPTFSGKPFKPVFRSPRVPIGKK